MFAIPQSTAYHHSLNGIRQKSLKPLPSTPLILFGTQLKPGIKLAVFTTNEGGTMDPYTQSLLQEAQQQGIQMTVFHPGDVVLQANGSKLTCWLKGQPYDEKPFDVVYPRLGARYVTEEALNILRHLESMGTIVINPPDGLRIAEDKYKTHLAFAKNNVPQPNTMYVPTQLQTFGQEHLSALNTDDIFIKPNAYTSGSRDVQRVRQATLNEILAYRTTEGMIQKLFKRELPHNILVQGSLAQGDKINDFRCMVFNNKILWTTQKDAISPEDTVYSEIDPTPEIESAAIKAVNAVGIRSATVDMVDVPTEGIKVLEVNPSPGLADEEEVDRLLDAVVSFANENMKPRLSLLA